MYRFLLNIFFENVFKHFSPPYFHPKTKYDWVPINGVYDNFLPSTLCCILRFTSLTGPLNIINWRQHSEKGGGKHFELAHIY